jgi:hypothetical protein
MAFFAFPEDARWNEEWVAVEFTVVLGEYHGTVRVGRRCPSSGFLRQRAG